MELQSSGDTARTAAVLKRLARIWTPENVAVSHVALNCGIGSSSLKADVKALDKLKVVRERDSAYSGSKYRSCTLCARCFGASKFAFDKRLIDHDLGRDIG